MSKDLKDVLDNIESSEKETAKLEEKIARLKELVNKQKRMISEQEQIIEQQKQKQSQMLDVPEDVIELKEIIGEQRALLKEREIELEHAKGAKAQAEKELQLLKQQSVPLEQKFNESFETIGKLKSELAEKKSDLLIKDEKLKNLEIKVQEIKSFDDKLKDEHKREIEELNIEHQKELKETREGYQKELKDLREEHKKEIKTMREEYQSEIQELQSQINQLDTVLLDSKLMSTEKGAEAKDFATRFKEVKEKQEELINRVEELHDKNREKEGEIKKLLENSKELREYKEKNATKIYQYERLTDIMQTEPLFKAFLIIRDVGGKGLSIEDLRKSIGSPIVMVKKFVQTLQDHDLIEVNDEGKLAIKEYSEEDEEDSVEE